MNATADYPSSGQNLRKIVEDAIASNAPFVAFTNETALALIDEAGRRFPDPEDDLFSDAMDAAAQTFHSVRWGIVHNAEKTGESSDGEKTLRRSLAAAFKAYVEFSK